MSDNLKRLREPAALAAAAFAGLSLLSALINLFLPPSADGVSEPFGNRAAGLVGQFAGIGVAAAVAFAVYLANDAGPAFTRTRLITQLAFVEGAVAFLFGVVTTLGQFGADGAGGSEKFGGFLSGAGGLLLVGVATWYARLSMQSGAPARAAAPAVPGGAQPSWTTGQPGTAMVGGFPAAPQAPAPPGPPPGGFGWTPQGAVPQAQPQYPGQGAGMPGVDHTQLLPPVPTQQQQQNRMPGQMSGPGQMPGPGQQAPLVPPSMQDYAPAPQPWAPSGSGQGMGQPPLPEQDPLGPQQGFPGQPPIQPRPDQRENPFTIGDWRE